MQRQRGELVPIAEALADLPGPVKALRRDRPPQRGFTLADQVNRLVGASEATPDRGFLGRTMALCSLPRSNPGQPASIRTCQRPLDSWLASVDYTGERVRFRYIRNASVDSGPRRGSLTCRRSRARARVVDT